MWKWKAKRAHFFPVGDLPGRLVPHMFPHPLIEHLESRVGLRTPDSPLASPAAWHQGRRWRGQVRPAVCRGARTDHVGPPGPRCPHTGTCRLVWLRGAASGGRGVGPPTPGGDRLTFRLAEAGRGKVYHITLESSHLLTSPIKVCVWGA